MRTIDMVTTESETPATDPGAQGTRATDAEMSARFQRDVIPLLEALHRHAVRITRNRDDAEDLVQETMVKTYSGFGSFEDGSNINAWLYRIMMNTHINAYRKNRRPPVCYPTEQVVDALLVGAARHTLTGWRSAEDEALEMMSGSEIQSAMCALPEKFRVPVYYADVEGLRYSEIAKLVDIPHGTVMSRLHRGRRQLRALLADAANTAARPSQRRTATSSSRFDAVNDTLVNGRTE